MPTTPAQDLKKLQDMAKVMKPGTTLSNVLKEACKMAALVKNSDYSQVPGGGNAVCKYDQATGASDGYKVRYQSGNIGNLVHELTHIAVNESYKRDFVNYASKNVPPPAVYNNTDNRTNEADRQGAWMDQAKNNGIIATLDTLKKEANKAKTSLTAQQLADVNNKLDYGRINPHIEFETVLNQILVWMYEWGYVPSGTEDKLTPAQQFCQKIDAAAKTRYDNRAKEYKVSTW